MSETQSIEQLSTFPPITNADWRGMYFGQSTALNRDAAQMVYDIAWFLTKDVTMATAVTASTFRVALARLESLPDPSAYSAWLGVIATNEAHRLLEESPTRRPSSALMPGADRNAFFHADTLGAMRADHKLAMLLRYRYNTQPAIITLALDMRPRVLARLFVAAREEWAQHSSLPPATLALATPPRTRQLPTVAEAYSKKEMKLPYLGYTFLETEFPMLPEREERRAKWMLAVATIVFVVLFAVLITRQWSAERPYFAPDAPGEILDLDER